MRYLAEFESWKSGFATTINEQETGTGKGFIVVFGSTDNDNLRAGAAEPLGFKENEVITGSIKGIDSMLKIGSAKSFENANHPGKTVKPGYDYLNVTADGKKYSIKERGALKIPFTKDTVLEIEGAGNGLLALMRALYYLNVSVTQNKFDYNVPFDGTLFIKIGETTRKGLSLSVNGKYTGPAGIRMSEGYADIAKKFIKESVDLGEAPKQDNSVEQIITVADTIADAIKASHFYKMKQQYKSFFSAYNGFRDMYDISKDYTWTKGNEFQERGSFFLAVSFQYCIATLSYYYPMDLSKIYKIDLEPYAKKIMDGQGSDLTKFDEQSIRTQIAAMFKQFEPKELKDYPEFKDQLPKYWAVVTNAVIDRIILTMPSTYKAAMTPNRIGSRVPAKGGIQTGKTEFGSGKI